MQNGHTALYHSVAVGHNNIARMLLKRGADPDIVAGKETALHYACRKEDMTMAYVLIDGGANPFKVTTLCILFSTAYIRMFVSY